MTEVAAEKDYTGVPTSELAKIFWENLDVDLHIFADRIGMDERDLKKVVRYQTYVTTSLLVAERILTGLELDHLLSNGGITIVAMRDSENCYRKMAEEAFCIRAEVGSIEEAKRQGKAVPSKEEMLSQIEAYRATRVEHCTRTPEQEAEIRRQSERKRQVREDAKLDSPEPDDLSDLDDEAAAEAAALEAAQAA